MMTNGLPVVPLGEFLTQRKEFFTIDDFVKYKRARVKSHGQGIVLRDEVNGTEIKTKKQQAARTGEFLVAEIDAKVGGFGIVPPELDGAVVSSHYFLFQIDENKCSKEWLNWFVRYNSLEEQTKAQGSTNYAAIRPSDVLNFEIPLPPLTEQRRIVAHIESLAARVNEAQRLREEATTLSNILQSRAFDGLMAEKNFEYQTLKDILGEPLQNGLSIPASGIGQEGVLFAKVGIVNTGKMNPRETKRVNIELSEDSTFWMKENDIFVSRGNSLELVGRAAAYKGIPPNCAFPDLLIRIRVDQTRIDPQYIVYYFQTLEARKYIESQASGTSPSMKKVSQPKLENMPIPVPPLDEQRRIVAYLDGLQAKVNAVRGLQSQSQEELDALLPSILDKAFKGEL